MLLPPPTINSSSPVVLFFRQVSNEVTDEKVELYIPDRYINHVDVNLEELISNLS